MNDTKELKSLPSLSVETLRDADEVVKGLKLLQRFMSKSQFAVIKQGCQASSEEHEYFRELVKREAHSLNMIPRIGSTDGKGDEAIVVAHYFMGGSDWWITEFDQESREAFGYVRLGSMPDCAELGYIGIEELIDCGVEMDLHWTYKSLKDVITSARG